MELGDRLSSLLVEEGVRHVTMHQIREDPRLLELWKDMSRDMMSLMHHIVRVVRVLAVRRDAGHHEDAPHNSDDDHGSDNSASTPPPSPLHRDEQVAPPPPPTSYPHIVDHPPPPPPPSTSSSDHIVDQLSVDAPVDHSLGLLGPSSWMPILDVHQPASSSGATDLH